MKLSVSLPADDVATLDEFVRTAGLPSRSAALQQAIRMLRLAELEQDYRAAWEEWESSGDQPVWDAAVGAGLVNAPR